MKKIPSLVLLALALAARATPAPACAVFPAEATFVNQGRPDRPNSPYLGGELGVVLPTFGTGDQVVAFRHLAGLPPLPEPPPEPSPKDVVSAYEAWISARDKAAGTGDTQSRQLGYFDWMGFFKREGGDFESFFANFTAESFRTAAKTLEDRVRRFGAASPEVKSWVAAQEIVFQNRPESGKGKWEMPPVRIPLPVEPGLDPLIARDRAYQVAAAHFYATRFDEAAALFAEIARDGPSPWKKWGRYMAARCMIRKATLTADFGQIDRGSAEAAEGVLKEILLDPELAEIHPAARRMEDFLEFRLRSRDRLKKIEARLLSPDPGPSWREDLREFRMLYSRHRGDAGLGSELSDLILSFGVVRSPGQEAFFRDALERADPSKTPYWRAWEFVALSRANGTEPEAASLADKAAVAATGSPGFLGFAYHGIRLDLAAGKTERAKKRLAALLGPEGPAMPLSSRNLFHGLRLSLASGFREWIALSPSLPARLGFEDPSLGREEQLLHGQEVDASLTALAGKPLFPAEALDALNRGVPLALWAEAARDASLLPAHLRRSVVLSAWARAVLLDDREVARAMGGLVPQVAPELAEGFQGWQKAASDGEGKFLAAALILETPRLKPFLAGEVPVRRYGRWSIDLLGTDGWGGWAIPRPPLGFLKETERAAGEKEYLKLGALGAPPDHLGGIVLGWARERPDDPRLPRALHLTVRATRHGQKTKETGQVSKAAFRILHDRFPESEWTKKTPYWY